MSTMRHVHYTPGCAPEELSVTQSAVPSPGPGEVLLLVAYAGVGGTDFAQRRGKFNPKPDTPAHQLVLGLEVSGTVAALGEGVSDLAEGTRVCALLYGGGYAEYAVVPRDHVLVLPPQLSLQQGAAVPENYWTVWA